VSDPQQAIIRAPELNDKLEAEYSKLFPNMAWARVKEKTGMYDRYPSFSGPLYDALPDLAKFAAGGILAKAGAAAAELGNIVSGGAQLANPTPEPGVWNLGGNHSPTKWANQMQQRGWTPQQIDEALAKGESFPAPNNVNPGNSATRYVNPQTGRSVVIDDATKEILLVGGDNFKY
jgi:hypothetical protein